MPNSGEYKSNLGLRDLYYALVTQDDASAYAAGTPVQLAPMMTASISPASNTKTQYADDGPFDTMSSEGETKLEFEVTQIPIEVRAIILGKIYDATTGRLFDNGGNPPDIALSFRSVKSNGKYHYVQYLKGKFTPPSKELAAKTDSPEPKSTKITFTAIKTTYQFVQSASITDGSKGVEGDEDIAAFSGTTWFSSVQLPVYTTPSALTCTPSPADGASSQATSVAITLTFNNALAGGKENGIGLLRSDTMAAIAVTRSINAARTVVTLTHSALTAAKTYLITVNGVTDVFGQSLADAVYDFATA
jgi:phi13 family phage major tail protein